MTLRNLFFSIIASAVACLALASAAGATVPRAFVSTQGLDTNPCSALQPCRSFNQALTVVQPGGEIIVQDSGGYSTGFTITQSVTIDAGGFNASVLSTTATDLCTINTAPTDRVVLRGISFHGAAIGTNAINATQVGSLYVEHCSMSEFTLDGVMMAHGGSIWLTNTCIRKCFNGLVVRASFATPANLVAHDCRFSECDNIGVFLVTSGTGAATGVMSNCTASLGGAGFLVESTAANNADLTLSNCRAFNNGSGMLAQTTSTGSATIRIADCAITQNIIGINTSSGGGGTASVIGTGPGTNLISGNGTDGATSSGVTLQ